MAIHLRATEDDSGELTCKTVVFTELQSSKALEDQAAFSLQLLRSPGLPWLVVQNSSLCLHLHEVFLGLCFSVGLLWGQLSFDLRSMQLICMTSSGGWHPSAKVLPPNKITGTRCGRLGQGSIFLGSTIQCAAVVPWVSHTSCKELTNIHVIVPWRFHLVSCLEQ